MKKVLMMIIFLAVPVAIFAATLPAKIVPPVPLSQRLAAARMIREQQSLTHQAVALFSASHQYGGLVGRQLVSIANSQLLAAQILRNDLQQAQRAGLPALAFGPVDTRALTLVNGDLRVIQARLQQLGRVRDDMASTYAKTLVDGAIHGLGQQEIKARQQVWQLESKLGILSWFR